MEKNPKQGKSFQALEKYFEHEQPLHLMYMKNYRVMKCDEKCDREKCINFHTGQACRRRPILSLDGTWNYTPKMCKNNVPCKMGDKCRYAHTKEECSYHPLVYKVNDCMHESIEKGKCSKWGFHCSFAHTDEDRRVKGTQQKNVLGFAWETFKAEACENPSCKLEDCIKFHNAQERRRNPFDFKYSPNPCNFVYQHGGFTSPENCPNKDQCNLAHTKNEVYYHADMYKTKVCRANPCYLKFCAFIHPGENVEAKIEEESKENFVVNRELDEIREETKENWEKIEEKKENIENELVQEKQVKNEVEVKEEKPEKNSIPFKLLCKYCREKEIKWIFECGAVFCGKCLGKQCSQCGKRHITRIDI